jgi:CBS domain-containing protein
LGFAEVFDYMAGKMDWLAYGLPVEKKPGAPSMVIESIEREVPTCGLRDPLGQAKQSAERFGFGICAVVNEHGVVLGLLRESAWKNEPAQVAENVMEPGPTTLRPSYGADDAAELLVKRKQDAILVTSSDGKLMGALRRRRSAAKEQTAKSESGHD